jgi:hypothetical protein
MVAALLAAAAIPDRHRAMHEAPMKQRRNQTHPLRMRDEESDAEKHRYFR